MSAPGEKGKLAEIAEKEAEEGAEEDAAEDQEEAVLPLRLVKSAKKRYREQLLIATVKWFLAASVIWFALLALKRRGPCAGKRVPVRLDDGTDLEKWAEGILTHNTTPRLEDVFPDKPQQALLYINAHRFLKELRDAPDTTRKTHSRARLYRLYQRVHRRLATHKTR